MKLIELNEGRVTNYVTYVGEELAGHLPKMDKNNKWLKTTINPGDVGYVESGRVYHSGRGSRGRRSFDYIFIRKNDGASAKLPQDYNSVIEYNQGE